MSRLSGASAHTRAITLVKAIGSDEMWQGELGGLGLEKRRLQKDLLTL